MTKKGNYFRVHSNKKNRRLMKLTADIKRTKILYQRWFDSRPLFIQSLIKDYPPGWYLIKAGAPYGISCPGTKVKLVSYNEIGMITVIVYAREKRPEALFHEKMLCDKFGRNFEETKRSNFLVQVEPKYLERIR